MADNHGERWAKSRAQQMVREGIHVSPDRSYSAEELARMDQEFTRRLKEQGHETVPGLRCPKCADLAEMIKTSVRIMQEVIDWIDEVVV